MAKHSSASEWPSCAGAASFERAVGTRFPERQWFAHRRRHCHCGAFAVLRDWRARLSRSPFEAHATSSTIGRRRKERRRRLLLLMLLERGPQQKKNNAVALL